MEKAKSTAAWIIQQAGKQKILYALGYVKDTSSGTLKNIMVERIDSIETTLAHILPYSFDS